MTLIVVFLLLPGILYHRTSQVRSLHYNTLQDSYRLAAELNAINIYPPWL
jgi:hypothetical protein